MFAEFAPEAWAMTSHLVLETYSSLCAVFGVGLLWVRLPCLLGCGPSVENFPFRWVIACWFVSSSGDLCAVDRNL